MLESKQYAAIPTVASLQDCYTASLFCCDGVWVSRFSDTTLRGNLSPFLIPGRLVAVKYLTLKRYHQRFPVAMEATERINPSGTSPSSLVVFDPATGDEDVNDSDIEL